MLKDQFYIQLCDMGRFNPLAKKSLSCKSALKNLFCEPLLRQKGQKANYVWWWDWENNCDILSQNPVVSIARIFNTFPINIISVLRHERILFKVIKYINLYFMLWAYSPQYFLHSCVVYCILIQQKSPIIANRFFLTRRLGINKCLGASWRRK